MLFKIKLNLLSTWSLSNIGLINSVWFNNLKINNLFHLQVHLILNSTNNLNSKISNYVFIFKKKSLQKTINLKVNAQTSWKPSQYKWH